MLRGARPLALLSSPAVTCAVMCAVACTLSGRAAEAGVSLQAELTTSAGVTDNAGSVPSHPLPGTLGPQSDFIYTLTPGLILTTGTARAVQEFTYLFNGIFYGENHSLDTYTNSLTWNGFYIPTKRLTMGTNFLVSEGSMSAFNNTADPSNPSVALAPAAVLNLLTVFGAESLAFELSTSWRLIQQLSFAETWYINTTPLQGITQTIPARVAIERAFKHDIIGLEGNVTYTNFLQQNGPIANSDGSIDPNGVVSPEQKQLAVSPLASWRRDFSYFINARAQLGAVVVFDPGTPSKYTLQPAGGAGINFFSSLASVDLSYAHGVTPNLLLRQNAITDTALLRLNVLFGQRSKFSASAGVGYVYSRELDATSTTVDATAHLISADASLLYSPWKFLSFFLRYTLVDQIGHASDPLPIESYHRDTLVFGLTAIYPVDAAAAVPKSVIGVRADGRDSGTIQSSKSANPQP